MAVSILSYVMRGRPNLLPSGSQSRLHFSDTAVGDLTGGAGVATTAASRGLPALGRGTWKLRAESSSVENWTKEEY